MPSFVFLCAIPTIFCVCLCILLCCICACVIVLWRNFRVVQQLHDRINRSFETVIREHILFVQLVDNSIVASHLVPASHSLQESVVMLAKWNTRARSSFRIVVILVCRQWTQLLTVSIDFKSRSVTCLPWHSIIRACSDSATMCMLAQGSVALPRTFFSSLHCLCKAAAWCICQ